MDLKPGAGPGTAKVFTGLVGPEVTREPRSFSPSLIQLRVELLCFSSKLLLKSNCPFLFECHLKHNKLKQTLNASSTYVN